MGASCRDHHFSISHERERERERAKIQNIIIYVFGWRHFHGHWILLASPEHRIDLIQREGRENASLEKAAGMWDSPTAIPFQALNDRLYDSNAMDLSGAFCPFWSRSASPSV